MAEAAELIAPDPVVRARLSAVWQVVREAGDGLMLVHVPPNNRMTLIVTVAQELDGRTWAHLSLAHPARMPTWEELREAKDTLLGEDWDAYQVLPRSSRYVNLHPTCLHLFACLDAEGGGVLPAFTRGSGSL